MTNNTLEAARKTAYRYLETTARSRNEIERRLERGGFPEEVVAQVIVEIEERGWLNDTEFARSWVEDRADRKQYGQRRLSAELQRKGIDSATISETLLVVTPEDELVRAIGAISKKFPTESLASLSGAVLQSEKRKIANYLLRRGFGWSIITQVYKHLMVNSEEY